MKGWEAVIHDPEHRKELVAGNLAEYAITGGYFMMFIPSGR